MKNKKNLLIMDELFFFMAVLSLIAVAWELRAPLFDFSLLLENYNDYLTNLINEVLSDPITYSFSAIITIFVILAALYLRNKDNNLVKLVVILNNYGSCSFETIKMQTGFSENKIRKYIKIIKAELLLDFSIEGNMIINQGNSEFFNKVEIPDRFTEKKDKSNLVLELIQLYQESKLNESFEKPSFQKRQQLIRFGEIVLYFLSHDILHILKLNRFNSLIFLALFIIFPPLAILYLFLSTFRILNNSKLLDKFIQAGSNKTME